KRLRGNIVCLSLYDAASGRAAIFATVKNSIGQLVLPGKDMVIYPDAFSGTALGSVGPIADVVYANRKGGLSQFVLLHQSPPSPPPYRMNPSQTRIEIFTEFLPPPTPQITTRILEGETNAAIRQTMAEPDWTDSFLDFGELKFIPG